MISIERCSRDQGLSLSSPAWGLGLDRDRGGLNWLDSMPVVTRNTLYTPILQSRRIDCVLVCNHVDTTISLQEGLLSLYRGDTDDPTSLTTMQGLERFRNSGVDLRDWHLGDGARRLSITNAIDILRRHVLKAIKRKRDRQLVKLTIHIQIILYNPLCLFYQVDNVESLWTEPGLSMIG